MKHSKEYSLLGLVLALALLLSCGNATKDANAAQGNVSPVIRTSAVGLYQVVSNCTGTTIKFDIEDKNNYTGTFSFEQNKYTPTVPGTYVFNSVVCAYGESSMSEIDLVHKKNGMQEGISSIAAGTWSAGSSSCVLSSTTIDLNGTTDYVTLHGTACGEGTMTISQAQMMGFKVSD